MRFNPDSNCLCPDRGVWVRVGKSIRCALGNFRTTCLCGLHCSLSSLNVWCSVRVQSFEHRGLGVISSQYRVNKAVCIITCIRSATSFAQPITIECQINGFANIKTRKALHVDVHIQGVRGDVVDTTVLESVVFKNCLKVFRLNSFGNRELIVPSVLNHSFVDHRSIKTEFVNN